MAERMVPNPRHAKLKLLLMEADNWARDVRQAYQPASSAMRSGKVWTGPTATRWGDELEDRHHRLRRLAQHLSNAIEDELRRHPAMVTESQAEAIRRELGGNA
ncbi:hypothetical protein [Sinosporangium siamense]|uniref:Uncharacterized protein n=1 Tax=Sinosporangium siamense TaxID=1367973 RepID=A0A919V4D1_9ACTN|nr:hypothetical protein [Sinosporangium siamense]GII91830.1 hypothetical protein Ssi02_20610 [Sinosporangium siamense]